MKPTQCNFLSVETGSLVTKVAMAVFESDPNDIDITEEDHPNASSWLTTTDSSAVPGFQCSWIHTFFSIEVIYIYILYIDGYMMLYPNLLRLYSPYAPWCWNMYQHLSQKSSSFVGKYTSTMVRIWVILFHPDSIFQGLVFAVSRCIFCYYPNIVGYWKWLFIVDLPIINDYFP